MKKFFRQATFYILILMITIALFQTFADIDTEEPEQMKYGNFVKLIESDEVSWIETEGNEIRGELKDGTPFQLYRPEDDDLTARLLEHDVPYDPNPEAEPAWWTTLLTYMLPFIILIAIFFFIMQQSQGGGSRVMNFGKSKARLYEGEKKNVTFDSVAGADEEKEELVEVVEFLKEPKKFIELGARIPKGVLLVGTPGTGKTLLGKAVAGEAGVPFFSISGSDFVEMFVGVGASRVRDLFENAKKSSPCIVFIDEIDAVGRQRGAGLGGGHDEREQTLNQLLVEMDGFDVNEGVIVIAATNRPDILDPALLRPGRFDRQIVVNAPDVKGRKEILDVHSRGKPLDEKVELTVIARRTPGFTGADLENIINEGALLAGRKNKKFIEMIDLEQAIDRVIAGTEKKSRVISEFEKKIVAYHEAGHALVGYLLPHTDPIHKVSIIPRGRAGGYTMMLPDEDRYYMTRTELVERITTLLAGRVAEESVLNEISTGAQNDLERTTNIVRQMIMEYGMSEVLGPITLGRKQGQVFLGRDLARDRDYSEEIASAIDREVKAIIDKCYESAEEIIENNRDKLEELAQALQERESLDAEEVAAIIEGREKEVVEREEKEEKGGKAPSKPAFELGYKAQEKNKGESTDTKGKLQLEINKSLPGKKGIKRE